MQDQNAQAGREDATERKAQDAASTAGHDAEESAAQIAPTEFTSPPTEEGAVHPASPDWEVAPEQPDGTSGTQGQETGQDSAPSVGTEDDAARREFLSDYSQSLRGEETPRQVAEEDRVSSSGHYEAQQVATSTAEPAAAQETEAAEVVEEPREMTRLAETTEAALQPGALVGEEQAVPPAPVERAPAATMVERAEQAGTAEPALAQDAPAAAMAESEPIEVEQAGATQPAIAPGAPATATVESTEQTGTVEPALAQGAPADASAAAATPVQAAPPRVAPLPQKSLSELAEGQVVTGRVKNLAAFGAFVDLGLRERKDGLIHVSQLADRRIGHPSEVVQIGQEVRVRVLGIDHDKGRISLTLRGADEVEDAPTSYKAAPAAEPEPPRGEATLQSLMQQFGRSQTPTTAAPQRDTRRAERDRREREEILRRMRGEGD